MMDIEIKRAEIADMERIMEWRMAVLHEVFDVPASQSMEELEQANRRYYAAMLPLDKHIACFACAEGRIVGCGGICLYQEMPSPDNPSGQCAYLMNIYTCPEFRGHGVGKEVVQWLVRQAKERQITKIYLETSSTGRRLYEKAGFTDMPDMMKL